jgi:NADP-dependent 3-hydroxy acid dehydrogenase YdfG
MQKIIEESRNHKVEVEILDLGSLNSIKDFTERIKSKLNKLDILINNAGNIFKLF